jgi:hypothetical protein
LRVFSVFDGQLKSAFVEDAVMGERAFVVKKEVPEQQDLRKTK